MKPTDDSPLDEGAGGVLRLRQRIAALHVTITDAEKKRQGINHAIASRRAALNRLLTQLAFCESGKASSDHGR